jgi:hypothetical protein
MAVRGDVPTEIGLPRHPQDPDTTGDQPTSSRHDEDTANSSAAQLSTRAPSIPPVTWSPDGPSSDALDAWAGMHPVVDLSRTTASSTPPGPRCSYIAMGRIRVERCLLAGLCSEDRQAAGTPHPCQRRVASLVDLRCVSTPPERRQATNCAFSVIRRDRAMIPKRNRRRPYAYRHGGQPARARLAPKTNSGGAGPRGAGTWARHRSVPPNRAVRSIRAARVVHYSCQRLGAALTLWPIR